MVIHEAATLDPRERRILPQTPVAALAASFGAIVLTLCFLMSLFSELGARRFWLAYVHNFAFYLSLSLGALFFVLIQHVSRAGWSVTVRRIAEIMAANLVVLGIAFLPIALVVVSGTGVVYRWAQPLSAAEGHDAHGDQLPAAAQAGSEGSILPAEGVDPQPGHVSESVAGSENGSAHETAHGDLASGPGKVHHAGSGLDALTLKKRAYLNRPFFIVRWIVYFAIWIGLGLFYWRRSLQQDESGDPGLTLSMQTFSGPGLVLFGLSVTYAAFDLLMSLDAHWFSTIFGVYYFSGGVVGFFAAIIIALIALQRGGYLLGSVTIEHFHDLGKWLFAFVFFWGYIAFSQYMLIWYGNIPEETGWFIKRGAETIGELHNAWSVVALFLLFGHFLIPFAGLMSRHVKRSRLWLWGWAVWMLALHWIDLWWVVMPELTPDYLPLGLFEIGCLLGLGGLYVAGLDFFARRRSLVPQRDPRLGEALAFQNI